MNTETAMFYYNKGHEAQQSGQLDQAIVSYQQAIESDAKCFEAYHKLGDIFQEQGKLNEAIGYYRKAIEIEPHFYWSHVNLGTVLAKISRWDEAVTAYRCAIDINPNLSIAYHTLGDVLQSKTQLEAAICAYQKAIELEPNFYWSHVNLGCVYYQQLNFEEAIASYQRALQLDSDSLPVHTYLGNVFTQQGKPAEAINFYTTATYKQTVASHPEFLEKGWELETVRQPDFIIIGAMKCATTSLYEYITQHPNVLSCLQKELDFFSLYFENGLDWYFAQFPPVPVGAKFLTGEASTNYMDRIGTEKRLFAHFPNVKLIAILRNPIERAISHYYHMTKYHPAQEQRSFEEAIFSEMELIKKLTHPSLLFQRYYNEPYRGHKQYGYFFRSLYIYFLEKWMTLFPKKQFLILSFEELCAHPSVTMKQVFEFLELPNYQLTSYPKYNSGSYDPLEENLRRTLSDFFAPYNQKLEQYLGQQFNWK